MITSGYELNITEKWFTDDISQYKSGIDPEFTYNFESTKNEDTDTFNVEIKIDFHSSPDKKAAIISIYGSFKIEGIKNKAEEMLTLTYIRHVEDIINYGIFIFCQNSLREMNSLTIHKPSRLDILEELKESFDYIQEVKTDKALFF